MYAVLAGGIGAARFLRGLVQVVDPRDLTVIVNVGDDIDLHGLRVSPDLDTITYTLSGEIHPEQQWGRAGETFAVAEELRRFGTDETWFTLGDRDLATHLFRTRRLHEGTPLSAITADVTRAFGLDLTLLPATDDRVETRILTADGRDLHFQRYWVGERGAPEVRSVVLAGAADAKPAPGVLEAIAAADGVIFCPSNPVVSIGTILDVPGIREAVLATTAPVVGVSPIIGGSVVRGMADRLLPAVGAEVSALGVATLYGELLDGWIVDQADADVLSDLRATGLQAEATDTMLDDPAVAAEVARTVLAMVGELRAGGTT